LAKLCIARNLLPGLYLIKALVVVVVVVVMVMVMVMVTMNVMLDDGSVNDGNTDIILRGRVLVS
jgi:hypothetical protein